MYRSCDIAISYFCWKSAIHCTEEEKCSRGLPWYAIARLHFCYCLFILYPCFPNAESDMTSFIFVSMSKYFPVISDFIFSLQFFYLAESPRLSIHELMSGSDAPEPNLWPDCQIFRCNILLYCFFTSSIETFVSKISRWMAPIICEILYHLPNGVALWKNGEFRTEICLSYDIICYFSRIPKMAII